MGLFNNKRLNRKKILSKVSESLSKTSQLQWSLDDKKLHKVSKQTVGMEAIQLVRDILSDFVWPKVPDLQYTGLRKTSSGMNQHVLDSGVVTVTATTKTAMGTPLSFDIPVEVRDGYLLNPILMIHGGSPLVLSQSAIDKVIRNASTYCDVPIRKQYSPPVDNMDLDRKIHVERRSPGMFSVANKKAALRDFIRTKGMSKDAQRKLTLTPDEEEVVQTSPKERNWYDPSQWGAPEQKEFQPTDPSKGIELEPELETFPVGKDPTDPLVSTRSQFCPSCHRSVFEDPKWAPYCSRQCYFTKKSSLDKCIVCDKDTKGNMYCSKECRDRQITRNLDKFNVSADNKRCECENEKCICKGNGCYGLADGSYKTIYGTSLCNQCGIQMPPQYMSVIGGAPWNQKSAAMSGVQSKFMPGTKVTTTVKLQAPGRGGAKDIIEKGTKGKVIRDQAGDGCSIYVELDDGRKVVISGGFLNGGEVVTRYAQVDKGTMVERFKNWNFRDPKDEQELQKWWDETGHTLLAKSDTLVDKVQDEVDDLAEDVGPVDIELMVNRKFPAVADDIEIKED
jgi:hypothetical protein